MPELSSEFRALITAEAQVQSVNAWNRAWAAEPNAEEPLGMASVSWLCRHALALGDSAPLNKLCELQPSLQLLRQPLRITLDQAAAASLQIRLEA